MNLGAILTSDPKEVLEALLQEERVDGDTDASALTKIEAAVAKLGKVVEARKKTLALAAAGSLASSTVGAERCSVNKISCLQPRGTFDFTLGHTGLELSKASKDASGSTGAPPELCVRWDQVSCVLRFPRPDPYKSDKAGMLQHVLVALKEPVVCGKSKVESIVLQVDGKKQVSTSLGPAQGEEAAGGSVFEGPEPETLAALLVSAAGSVGRVGCFDSKVFQSGAGNAMVACFWGVKDGHLWPLKHGMAFLKPPLFIPIDDISAMSVASDPRRQRVEMTVETESGKSYEFGQIPKEELEPLQSYAGFIAQRRQKQENAENQASTGSSSSSSAADAAANNNDNDDDDDDSDEESDFEPSGSESSGSSESEDGDDDEDAKGSSELSKKSKAKSKAAVKEEDQFTTLMDRGGDATDDDDEEGGEGEGGGDDESESGEGSSDDDDDSELELESNPAMSGDEGDFAPAPPAPDGQRSMRSKRPSATVDATSNNEVATANKRLCS